MRSSARTAPASRRCSTFSPAACARTGGQLTLGGAPVALASPRDALARGIGLVHQEMLAFPNLSVAANIFAGREITEPLRMAS